MTAVTMTRLEKAATDNGFDLELARTADWLCFGSTQTSLRIWLTAIGPSQFAAAMSRSDVLDGLAGLGVAFTNPLPSGAAGALTVSDVTALHRLLRRAFHLSRTLPDALLRAFQTRNRAPAPHHGSRATGGAASRPGHLPPWPARILGWPLCDHWPRRTGAPPRQPHQALGRLRHRRRAARHLQRPATRTPSRCRPRRRLHHNRTRRHRARLEHSPSRRPVSPWTRWDAASPQTVPRSRTLPPLAPGQYIPRKFIASARSITAT